MCISNMSCTSRALTFLNKGTSSLGIKTGIKCFVDDHSVTFSTDTLSYLQNIEVKHPVDQYIVSVCQAFHRTHGSNVKTLLYMIGALVEAATILKNEGVPLSCINRHMKEGIETCCNETEAIKIPIKIDPYIEKTVFRNNLEHNKTEPAQVNDEREIGEHSSFQASMIYLQMKNTSSCQDNCKEDIEDEDDISWYFQEDKPVIEDPDVDIPKAPVKSDFVDNISDEDVKITSLKHTSDSDSEFDDCFEAVPCIVKTKDFVSSAKLPPLRKEPLNKENAVCLVPSCSVENEELQDNGIDVMATQSESRRKEFEENLHKKLECKLSKPKVVLNQSRHFKTVFSSVEELQENQDKTQICAVASSEELSRQLSSNEQSRIFSFQSEHFKTDDISDIETLEKRTHPDGEWNKASLSIDFLIDGDSLGNEEGKSDNMLQPKKEKFQKALNLKLDQFKPSKFKTGLSSSRHFRTFENCILPNKELNDKKENPVKIDLRISSTEDLSEPSKAAATDLQAQASLKFHDQKKKMNDTRNHFEVNHDTRDFSEISNHRTSKERIDLRTMIQGLCHGVEPLSDLMHTAVIQSMDRDVADCNQKFDIHRITCLCMDGSFLNKPLLVRGLTVAAPMEILPIIEQNKNHSLSCILVNGDLTRAYHHKGFKPTVSSTTVYSVQEYASRSEDVWLTQLEMMVSEYSIGLVLCKGTIEDKAKTFFESRGIVAIEAVSYKSLLSLAVLNMVTMVTYIGEVSEAHIINNIHIEPMLEDWSLTNKKQHAVKVSCNDIVTVLYYHPCEIGRLSFETDFHRSLSVISSTLQSGYVLPGKGQTEKWCGEKLQQLNDWKASGMVNDLYKPRVFSQLATVMLYYHQAVLRNVFEETEEEVVHEMQSSPKMKQFRKGYNPNSEDEADDSLQETDRETEMSYKMMECSFIKETSDELQPKSAKFSGHFDDVKSKMAVWRTAFETMATIMQIDTYIVTGQNNYDTCHYSEINTVSL